jgi:hypothetical protein
MGTVLQKYRKSIKNVEATKEISQQEAINQNDSMQNENGYNSEKNIQKSDI